MTNDLEIAKLHGLGNDFLVVFDHIADNARTQLARTLCDRHRGIGADGLLFAQRGAQASQWSMILHNADGTRAEMSGNGIRCFAHAIIRHEATTLPCNLDVETDGGHRFIVIEPDPQGNTDMVWATVSMGHPLAGPSIPETGRPDVADDTRMMTWDLGNPHLVIEVDEPSRIDPALHGPHWEALFPEGMNVHFVHATSSTTIDMVTWERGAGVTQACGTGATATALSARNWGLVGDETQVYMPGGSVHVTMTDAMPTLRGPSQWIADAKVHV